MLPHQLWEEMGDEIGSDGWKHADGESTEIGILFFLDDFLEASGLIEHLLSLSDDSLSSLGGDDGLSSTVEDLDAQLIFQFLNHGAG